MDGAAEAEGAREEWSKRVDEAEGGVEVPLIRFLWCLGSSAEWTGE